MSHRCQVTHCWCGRVANTTFGPNPGQILFEEWDDNGTNKCASCFFSFSLLIWLTCCCVPAKVAEVTNDTVLLQWMNNLETGETFKSSVVPAVPVTHRAGENVQKKMGGIQNQPDHQLFGSCQSKTQTVLPSSCW